MDNTIPVNSNHPWTAWQKIAFRFFFPFLTLQVLSENFMGNLFGRTLYIWQLGERIFVPPCVWLNDHFFHFHYISGGWTTFSLALHTIRDAVYLVACVLICAVWTLADKKRKSYNKLLYWFSQALIAVLAAIVFCYGIIKVFPVQMQPPSLINMHRPLGELTPFDLLWSTFGYGKPYQVFGGICEVLGAVLILFKRTRVAGLLSIAAVMVNVIMVNYTYQVGVLMTSFYILLVSLFLLAPYSRQLYRFFFTRQWVTLQQELYKPAKNSKTILFFTATLLFTGISFLLTFQASYNLYNRFENTNRTRQYSLVKNFVVNSDTLALNAADSLSWRIWSERVTDGKRLVTIATAKQGPYKTYTIEQDSLHHTMILYPFNQQDTMPLHFGYTTISAVNWRLEGVIQQQHIQVELQKFNPDTTENLLRIKRTILTFDDDPNVQ